MGVGFFRKLKEFAKKAWNWGKTKLWPTVKKVWTFAKPVLQAIPQTHTLTKVLTPILGSGGPSPMNNVAAVKNTVSPFIKLKKNSVNVDSQPMVDTGGFTDVDI